MFPGNVLITGGEFHNVARTHSSFSFDKLTQKSSPRAFHLANSDISHSTCLVNTRVNVLQRMKDWALRKPGEDKDKSIMWLYGAAGGGKTAIARTIAQWCDKDEGILLGEFFFSRTDGTADLFGSLVPTLAYRMVFQTCEKAKDAIYEAVSRDPHIFHASLADQFKKLILDPLDHVSDNNITPYVIIIDGLDEQLTCEQQLIILNVLSEAVCEHNSTLRILICSRPEPHIFSSFNDSDSQLNRVSAVISLNDDVHADSDIRLFLMEKFRIVKKHIPRPLKEWPTPANIDYLQAKSSGQFIYAATVEKYVCSPPHRHQAESRLEEILNLGLLPQHADRERHPFADLDALYTLILKTRLDVKKSVKIMAICLEYPKHFDTISPSDLGKVLGLGMSRTWPYLEELASVLEATEDNIRPFHASFEDFLFDKSRSGDLYVSRGTIVADIACGMLTPSRDPQVLHYRAFYLLLKEAEARKDLMDLLAQMSPAAVFSRTPEGLPSGVTYYLVPLLRLLRNYVTPEKFEEVVAYFDQNFAPMLPHGKFAETSFCEEIKGQMIHDQHEFNPPSSDEQTEKNADSENLVVYDSSSTGDEMEKDAYSEDQSVDTRRRRAEEHDCESDDDDERRQAHKYTGPESELASFSANTVAALTIFPEWDEVTVWSEIRLLGPGFLRGLCDEAKFAREHLPATTAKLRDPMYQELVSRSFLGIMHRDTLPILLLRLIVKLLPHSLKIAEPTFALWNAFTEPLLKPHLWQNDVPRGTLTEFLRLFYDLHRNVLARPESKGKEGFMESQRSLVATRIFGFVLGSVRK